MINVLFIGDVCGRPGREAVASALPGLRKKHDIDIVITNIENLAHGRGASVKTVREIMSYGVDFMTAGNHIWRHKDFEELLSGEFPIIRAINYPDDLPGVGFKEIDLGRKGTMLVIAAMGKAFFYNERTLEEPFRRLDKLLREIDYDKYSGIFIDFHAEATAEKLSAGLYFDGRVSALVGTHTHIPTADERVLPNGTAYINDVGMAGPKDSSLWVKKEIVFAQNMFPYSPPYDIETEGPRRLDAVVINIDSARSSTAIKRINLTL
jgi:2',3'-cyclic-nucleotide 2'-phosphodiesterase